MTKSQFKKLYSNYRKTETQFRERLANGNYPCGYDDALCDQFDHSRTEWLGKNPILKAVVEALSYGDALEDRLFDLAYMPKNSMRWNALKSSIEYRLGGNQ